MKYLGEHVKWMHMYTAAMSILWYIWKNELSIFLFSLYSKQILQKNNVDFY